MLHKSSGQVGQSTSNFSAVPQERLREVTKQQFGDNLGLMHHLESAISLQLALDSSLCSTDTLKLVKLLTTMKEEINSTGNNIFLLKVFIKILTFRVFPPLQYSGNILAGQSWLSFTSELGIYCSRKLISNHTGSPQEFLPRGYSFRTSSRDLNCFLYGEKNNISVIDWPFFRYLDIWRMSVHSENLGAGMAPKAPHILKGTFHCMAGKG